MEIERKFLLSELPKESAQADFQLVEQAYLCTDPVVRIRRQDHSYYLTYKGSGKMCREEYNLPLNKEAYEHLLPKTDGNPISKKRFLIPLKDGLTAEVDCFDGLFRGLFLAEVEFPDVETARAFLPPVWFGKEVTEDGRFHNSYLSGLSPEQIPDFLEIFRKSLDC